MMINPTRTFDTMQRQLKKEFETDKFLLYLIPVIIITVSLFNIYWNFLGIEIYNHDSHSAMKIPTSCLFILISTAMLLVNKFTVVKYISLVISIVYLILSILTITIYPNNSSLLVLLIFVLLNFYLTTTNLWFNSLAVILVALIFIGYLINVPVMYGYINKISNAVSFHANILFLHIITWIYIFHKKDGKCLR